MPLLKSNTVAQHAQHSEPQLLPWHWWAACNSLSELSSTTGTTVANKRIMRGNCTEHRAGCEVSRRHQQTEAAAWSIQEVQSPTGRLPPYVLPPSSFRTGKCLLLGYAALLAIQPVVPNQRFSSEVP